MGTPAAISVAGLAQTLLGWGGSSFTATCSIGHVSLRGPFPRTTSGVGWVQRAQRWGGIAGKWLFQPPCSPHHVLPATKKHFYPSPPHLSDFSWNMDPAEIIALTMT